MADPSDTSSTRAFNLVELDVTRNKVSPQTEKGRETSKQSFSHFTKWMPDHINKDNESEELDYLVRNFGGKDFEQIWSPTNATGDEKTLEYTRKLSLLTNYIINATKHHRV